MEIFNLIKDNPEYCRAAFAIYNNFEKFCEEIFTGIDEKIQKERIKCTQDHEENIKLDCRNISYPYKEIDADRIIAVTMEISDRGGIAFGYTMLSKNKEKRTKFKDFGLTEDEIKIALKDSPCQIFQIAPENRDFWIHVDKGTSEIFPEFKDRISLYVELLGDKEKREKFIEDCANELNKLLQGSED